jgi:hypothetical protein
MSRFAWFAVFLTASLVCLSIARLVPPDEGGLMPAGLLLLTLVGLALRRRTVPRSGRTV